MPQALKRRHCIMDFLACQRDIFERLFNIIKQWFIGYITVKKHAFLTLFSPHILALTGDHILPVCDRGSRYSLSPSPKKLNHKMVKNIASEGNRIKCG